MYNEINKKRINKVMLTVILMFILLICRTAYISLVWGKELSVITDNQYKVNENISNINYSLLDCNGKELLQYIPKYYFVVDPDSFLKNNRDSDLRVVKTVIYILRNYNKDYDLTQLSYKDKNKKIYYSIDEDTYNKLKDIKGVKGVYAYVKNEVDRTYPWRYENLLTNTSTTDNQRKDKNSIEGYVYEKTKGNDYPKMVFEKDLVGEYKSLGFTVPENTINLKLTTDKEIETLIKDVLLNDKYKNYNQIGAVLMEASTGKIKAMVQRDDWKPNINLCSATENGYEPGSIFKTIVAETLLEENSSLINKTYKCDETKENHGIVDMKEAFTESCNAYFQKISSSTKADRILGYAKAQGLFSKVLNFNGTEEVAGDFVAPTSANGALKNISIGQSMRITPVQALSIVNTVANDGKYVKPYIIDSFVDGNNNTLETYKTEEKQILKKSTVNNLKSMMLNVVRSSEGTGRQAYLPNIEIGGKTGTNERTETVTVDNGGEKKAVQQKKSDGWFVGFFKLGNQYYSMVVFTNDIDVDTEAAGSTAAPIFKEIVKRISDNN